MGLERLLEQPDEAIFERVDAASLAEHGAAVAEDPVLLAAFRRANRATIMHWAEANLRDPGAEVPAFLGQEGMSLARDLVRRGLDAQALEPYRAGQNAAWQAWMQVAFTLTDDADELRELLEVSARSIFAFVDATMAATLERIGREREELTRGSGAERLETVTLVLEEAPIDHAYAARRLRYAFDRTHLAAVIWSDGDGAEEAALERAGRAIAAAAGADSALTVRASTAAVWAWVAVQAEFDPGPLEAALDDLGEVRVALGTPASGLVGFRSSHADALAAQRLVVQLGSGVRLARHDELGVAALVAQDAQRAIDFAGRTLGELSEAPPALRETLRTYLRMQSNASRTAEALFAHRNTILGRLAKAEALLPRPLAGSVLEVAVALEVLHWRNS